MRGGKTDVPVRLGEAVEGKHCGDEAPYWEEEQQLGDVDRWEASVDDEVACDQEYGADEHEIGRAHV